MTSQEFIEDRWWGGRQRGAPVDVSSPGHVCQGVGCVPLESSVFMGRNEGPRGCCCPDPWLAQLAAVHAWGLAVRAAARPLLR